MELDEFKAHWNSIQQKEINKPKHTTETLNRIIMNTTNTLGQLQQKNIYWNKMGKAICSMLIGILLVMLVILYFTPDKAKSFGTSAIYVAIMIIYALVTMWVYNRQEQIFRIYTGENLRETLRNTLSSFKRFYVLFNLIYIILYPAYYYAFIKLLIPYWTFSTQTALLISGGLTILSFIFGHWYYRVKYFKKIKMLEADLRELESE